MLKLKELPAKDLFAISFRHLSSSFYKTHQRLLLRLYFLSIDGFSVGFVSLSDRRFVFSPIGASCFSEIIFWMVFILGELYCFIFSFWIYLFFRLVTGNPLIFSSNKTLLADMKTTASAITTYISAESVNKKERASAS